jgi:dTDP-4-dehydrorhamnose reductase
MQPILITGGGGTLGSALRRACEARGLAHAVTARAELDIADESAIDAALEARGPWLVVNTAGYVRVDDAEWEPERCWRENSLGPVRLARACARRGVALVTFSSDLVFDGRMRRPYQEDDTPAPLNVYGHAKAYAELNVLAAHPRALVIRTSAFFGPCDDANFVTVAWRALAAGRRLQAAEDTVVSPTYVPDLVNAALDLAIDEERGIWHLANEGAVSWAELARELARRANLDSESVEPVPLSSLCLTADRPRWSALGSARGALLPSLDDALGRYLHDSAAYRGRLLELDRNTPAPATKGRTDGRTSTDDPGDRRSGVRRLALRATRP